MGPILLSRIHLIFFSRHASQSFVKVIAQCIPAQGPQRIIITCLDHFRDERAGMFGTASHHLSLPKACIRHMGVKGQKVSANERQDWTWVFFSRSIIHVWWLDMLESYYEPPSSNLTGALFRHCFCGTFAKLSWKILCKSTKQIHTLNCVSGFGSILCLPLTGQTVLASPRKINENKRLSRFSHLIKNIKKNFGHVFRQIKQILSRTQEKKRLLRGPFML